MYSSIMPWPPCASLLGSGAPLSPWPICWKEFDVTLTVLTMLTTLTKGIVLTMLTDDIILITVTEITLTILAMLGIGTTLNDEVLTDEITILTKGIVLTGLTEDTIISMVILFFWHGLSPLCLTLWTFAIACLIPMVVLVIILTMLSIMATSDGVLTLTDGIVITNWTKVAILTKLTDITLTILSIIAMVILTMLSMMTLTDGITILTKGMVLTRLTEDTIVSMVILFFWHGLSPLCLILWTFAIACLIPMYVLIIMVKVVQVMAVLFL